MINDIRVYNYYDDEPLITRESQMKDYLDKKFSSIKVDVDLSEVNEKLDKIDGSSDEIISEIRESKSEIIEEIKDSRPCLCHLATKEDICHAKCEIIGKVEHSKREIIHEIDEKMYDLNELIKEKQ